MLLLPEEQLGEAWEPSKKQCSFGSQGIFGRKVPSLLPSSFFQSYLFYLPVVGVQVHCFAYSHTWTLGRTFRYKRSARPRNLYLTKHDTHEKQTSMAQAEFEPAIPARERPQTYAVDHKVIRIFSMSKTINILWDFFKLMNLGPFYSTRVLLSVSLSTPADIHRCTMKESLAQSFDMLLLRFPLMYLHGVVPHQAERQPSPLRTWPGFIYCQC
jgi:hypothetical protein